VLWIILHLCGCNCICLQVRFTAISGKKPLTVESEVCRHCVCNNVWHSLTVQLRGDSVTLAIDDAEPKTITAPLNYRPLRLRRDLYIGGYASTLFYHSLKYDCKFYGSLLLFSYAVSSYLSALIYTSMLCVLGYATPQAALTTKEKFHGCLKNIGINGVPLHWHGVSQLLDVYVSGCPLVK
jgi:hypothetical protein